MRGSETGSAYWLGKFFDKTGLEFSWHLLDDYRLAYDTFRTSTQFQVYGTCMGCSLKLRVESNLT